MSWRSIVAVLGALSGSAAAAAQGTLAQQNQQMFQQMQQQRGLSEQQMRDIEAIFARSGFMGQGNPAISEHPETEQQCQKKLAQQRITYSNPRYERICGAKFMAPLYDPRKVQADSAKV